MSDASQPGDDYGELLNPATREGQREIALLRERFLNDPSTPLTGLRPAIITSWTRSMRAHSHGREPRKPSPTADSHVDEQTLECAHQVLGELSDMVSDVGGYLTLVSPGGAVSVGYNAKTQERFPVGLTVLEEVWGTNSDGTAIEDRHGMQVWGAENFPEEMQDLYGASALIKDPIRNSIRAILGMALPIDVALETTPGSLRLFVEGAAARVTQELSTRITQREQILLSHYLSAVRRNRGGVLAYDDRMTIVSRPALDRLTRGDYAVIETYVSEALESGVTLERDVRFADERETRVRVTPAVDAGSAVNAGVIVSLLGQPPQTARSGGTSVVTASGGSEVSVHEAFCDLVGVSSAFRKTVQDASEVIRRSAPAHLVGEPGTGKQALGRRILSGRGLRVECLDAAKTLEASAFRAAADAGLRPGAGLLVRNAEMIGDEAAAVLGEHLRRCRTPAIVLAMRRHTPSTDALTASLQSTEIQVPSLRNRREDVPALIRHFLERHLLKPSEQLVRELADASWPGNLAQLEAVTDQLAAAAGGPVVGVEHLPWGVRRSAARGRLTRLEEAEVQELRQALAEAGGNKVRAAEILQIGRSTLYRRLEMYRRRGLDLEQ